MLVSEALDRYVVQLEADGRSRHTVAQARRHVLLLDGWLGGARDVDTVTHEDLAQFLTSDVVRLRADGEPRKPTTANALRSSVKTFLSFAHAAGYTAQNPGRLVRRAICGTPLPKALSEAEHEKLLATLAGAKTHAERRDRVLFELILGTGVRIGSALAIRVEDVNLERAEITLRKMKFGREARVYLPESVTHLIAEWLGIRTQGYAFPGAAIEHLTQRNVSRRLAQWCSKAGISGVSPHGLRHTFATRLYRRTGDIGLVREALCHASIASTIRYAAVETEKLKMAVKSCNRTEFTLSRNSL